MRWVIRVVAVLYLGGCGDGGGAASSDAPCALTTSGSGAATWSFDGDPACSIPFGSPTGILMGFVPIGDIEPKSFEVYIDDVREGETGTFTGYAAVTMNDDRRFATPRKSCMIRIATHEKTGESDGFATPYQISGDGTCAMPAVTTMSGETVTIDPFEYRFPPRW
jgi:hypothetical protein